MVRGSLVSAIYRKTIQINTTSHEVLAAVTLMSTDIERITYGIKWVHEVWSDAAEIGVATWLLQRELGAVCIAPVIVSVGVYFHI